MYYRHDLPYEYPEECDGHMIKVKHTRNVKFDKDYPYLDKRRRFKFMRGVYWVLVNGIVFPITRLSHGLRIYGKENYKKHKKSWRAVLSPSPTTFSIGTISACSR